MFYLKVELCFFYFLFSIIMKCNFSLLFLCDVDVWWLNYGARAPNIWDFPLRYLIKLECVRKNMFKEAQHARTLTKQLKLLYSLTGQQIDDP